MILISAIFVFGLHLASTQNPNCDFYQQVEAGRTYYINNPGSPGNYAPGVQCRWISDCPPGYRCRLNCPQISIPQSQSCSLDRLLVSVTGDTTLSNAQAYCGSGSLNLLSSSTRLSIGLISDPRSPGGWFSCSLTAEATAPSCRCGDRRQMLRIVGGVETGVNEFPSMVALVDARISLIRCGGVIISEWYVLSAAHCVIGESPQNYAAVVGEHDTRYGDSPATAGYRVSSFIVHPWYTESNYDYDISLIRVANQILFSDRVGPVCLPFKYRNWDFTGNIVTLLGWGTLVPGGPNSNTLQKVDVNVVTQGSCRTQISTLTDRQMCTFAPGRDSCQNDSGGPALFADPNTNGRLYSVGIISFGRSCASGFPGVNTRVTAVLDWIEQATPGTNYCNV